MGSEYRRTELLALLEDAKQYITPTISTHEEIAHVLRNELGRYCN